MGVDISHIYRHGFYNVYNGQKSMDFTLKTIENLKKNLLIRVPNDDYFEICQESKNKPPDTSFKLPVYDVDFNLHSGFWRVESYYHYVRIIMHHGNYFHLRRMSFDIARALKKEEAWYAEELYTCESTYGSYPDTTFQKWLKYTKQDLRKDIKEYDESEIMSHKDYNWKFEPVYHDSFKECKELFDSLQKRLKGFRLLGLMNVGNGFLRCEKDGMLYLINEDTMEHLFKEPIEGMLYSLNGLEIIVIKDGLQAVFDENGKQLTVFVNGVFTWCWTDRADFITSFPKRIIYNKEAGIELAPR